MDNLYAAIGYGAMTAIRLYQAQENIKTLKMKILPAGCGISRKSSDIKLFGKQVVVKGVKTALLGIRCCNPVPVTIISL